LPRVDADRIGVIGICGGGGYAINATLTEKRIKAVVSITGVNVGRLFRESFSNYDPLDAMAAQRTKEARAASFGSTNSCPPARMAPVSRSAPKWWIPKFVSCNRSQSRCERPFPAENRRRSQFCLSFPRDG